MDEGSVEAGIPPQAYAISLDEFSTHFSDTPIPYKEGNKVTRQNLTPFFIHSFAVSRGQISAQALYLDWKGINDGFDYRETLENLFQAGGVNSLGNVEVSQIASAIKRISAHSNEDLDIGKAALHSTDAELAAKALRELRNITIHDFNRGKIIPYLRLRGMEFGDLVKAISVWNEERKASSKALHGS